MQQLLELCGFEPQDIVSSSARIKRAFTLLGIDDKDIGLAKKRLNTYYDMSLASVRKGLGLCLKETANTVLAREDGKKKIIYGFMSPGTEIFGSALHSRSDEVFVANLNGSIQFVMGAVFNKSAKILSAAESKWLKGGKAYHCANVKTTVGLITLGLIPEPDLLITSGLLCDTAPKTLDIIEQMYGIPTCSYDICSDVEFREYPDSARVMQYAIKSTRHLVKRMEEVVGFEITDSMLMETIRSRSVFAEALSEIRRLQETSDPIPIRVNHDIIWHCVSILARGVTEFEEPTDILKLAVRELSEKVRLGKGAVKKGLPRILSLLPGHFTDPRWEFLPYEYGLSVVSSENGFFPPHGKRTLDIGQEDTNDPYEIMLRYLKNSLIQNLSARIETIIAVCKNFKVDGVLDRYHVGCRVHIPDVLIMKEAIVQRLGLPVLLLEYEGFDPRFCNEDRYRKQLEYFSDMVVNSGRGPHGCCRN